MVNNSEFYANVLVIDILEFDVISGINCLSTFNAVINYQKRSTIFRVLNHPMFTLIRGSSQIKTCEFKACPMIGVLAYFDMTPTKISVISEFLIIFEDS